MNGNGNGKPHDDLPPFNTEAETGLIASLFALPEAADLPAVAALTPGDFGLPEHRILYRHLVGIRLAGQTPEVLPARLHAANEQNIPGVADALNAAIAAKISGGDAVYFADLIRETAHRRRQWEFARELAQQVRDNMPVDDIDAFAELFVEARKDGKKIIGPKTVNEMLDTYTQLRHPVIYHLARMGETINVVAPSKRGKSWLVLLLALCIVTGKRWLDYFACVPGRCLIVDNELHRETSTDRVRKVAEALGLERREYGDRLQIDNVRGRNLDIDGLGKYLLQFPPGHFTVVILDALYRFLPRGTDENSNGDMGAIYNKLDAFAERQQCVFVCIVHSSKGSQADKAIVDVGSGAGAQARATDSHCVLRQHEEPDAVVLDVAPRSWPPLNAPICLRWKWPLWTVDDTLDPAALHRPGKNPKAAEPEPEMTAERFAETFGTPEPKAMPALVEAGCLAGLGERKAANLVRRAAAIGKLHKWPTDDKREFAYATVPAPPGAVPKPKEPKAAKRRKKTN